MRPQQSDEDGDALLERGAAAFEAGRLDEAIAAFRAATEIAADRSRAWNDLGVALRAAGHVRAAVACYRRALAHDPDGAETWSNLGNARRQLQQLADAERSLRRAIALDPDEPVYLRNLGLTLVADGRPASALGLFEDALARDPGNADVQFQRGCCLLQLGRYADGWAGYERRFEAGQIAPRDLAAPLWDGQPLTGATLLVHAEQGHGDMMQFARFLPTALARAGGRLVVECHPALRRLFAATWPEVPVVAVGEALPAHDLRLPMASLPHALALPDAAVGMERPYLRAPAGAAPVALPSRTGRLRVGLTWTGKTVPWDRSCPFARLAGLLEVVGAEFFSLQRGDAAADITRCGAAALVTDVGHRLADFADDAALLATVDLVVTVDTALAHLAGALGRPVWVLLTYSSDWRYPAGRATTDWYPSMRLFRQPRPGDWAAVIEAVAAALAERARAG